MAYIADTTSVEDRAKGVGLMGAAIGPGMIFGPLLGNTASGWVTRPDWLPSCDGLPASLCPGEHGKCAGVIWS
jgi:hypothetical protein